ncbi:MAG: DUF1905 domain-containing protein [Geodermatophilaceae bacterium]|nr:DUF1905 domain-containing protein [Geodermatophilaceae bacterium]
MRFRTTVELGGKTATGMRVPPDVIAGLSASKKPAVRITINGYTYRTTVAPRGGGFLIPISAENRVAAGVGAGDEVDVDIEVDDAPREVTVPADFTAALAADATAEQFFAGLSYSQRQWFVLGIEDAKTSETRQRRIEKAVDRLHSGRGQR